MKTRASANIPRAIAELDDKNDEMLVAVAAVTVLVEPN